MVRFAPTDQPVMRCHFDHDDVAFHGAANTQIHRVPDGDR